MVSLKSLFGGDESAKILRRLSTKVGDVNRLEADIQSLSDEALKGKTVEFQARLSSGTALEEILPEAFAVVREASRRTLGQRHFDVQLVGGMVLNEAGIAEMKTGEGKTLVATLPVYLNALTKKGVHVITVNDYLSRRDAVWMGQIYSFLGLSVGVINHESSFVYDPTHTEKDQIRDSMGAFKVIHEFLRPSSRQEAYAADITYGTNNEFGFDYLRDNLSYKEEELRQRGHYYAVVDEIDSILIDEARTPLIISAPTSESENLYVTFAQIAGKLTQDEDYTVDEKHKAALVTEKGIEKAEKLLGIENIYTEGGMRYVHHLETALRAKALFHLDKEYVVREGQVVIVDEFTGRLQPGRRWSEGLHQAIEAKEGVSIQKESRTYASITFQNYFRMYEKLSGMTGTALTSSEEFYKVYGLETVAIPTNKTPQRIDKEDLIFQTEKGKFTAIARKVKELHSKGQPVLVGTVSIDKNELLSAHLKYEGVPHVILNAKNHEQEGEIIAQAGEKGRVTIATNMAGRGVDIKLGGNPGSTEAYEEIKNVGGLFVLGTERHEARRIDNQLRGRSGRQGDPGETQFYVSLEDNLMRVFAAETLKRMMGRFGIPEDQPIENSLISRSLEAAQGKIEGFNFDSRKHVLEFDDILNKQRSVVYEKRRTVLTGTTEEIDHLLEALSQGDEELQGKIKEKREKIGENFYPAIRTLYLQAIDLYWVEHLELMDYARGSVNLRAYGQRDPLIEYRKEGSRLFQEMLVVVDEKIKEMIPNLGESQRVTAPVAQVRLREVKENASGVSSSQSDNRATENKMGRNDQCPCGSGKKWKKCGMLNTEEHQKLMAQKK